ncbi:MAG: hypothetical protein A4S09_05460 [Proteobacteria bacterium SG_bin7]|nr:MAG: hypothetical protein A4S09_05460 [Proteobacteria bacterium SG_bin7]
MLESFQSLPAYDQFIRIETKFFIPRSSLRGLESLLYSYMSPVDGTKTAGFTKVESHYIETPELTFFTDALKKPQNRMKVRIRKYYDGGTKFQGSFIEIKRKENGVSKKKRFRIGDWEESEILRGHTLAITPRLESLNFNLRRDQLISRVTKINELIENQKPKYAARVAYERRAFEKQDLRITIDQNLESEIIYSFLPIIRSHTEEIMNSNYWLVGSEMQKIYDRTDFAVVEVKHSGKIPEWMVAGFKYLMCAQDVSFSKYVWSISEAISGRISCRDLAP